MTVCTYGASVKTGVNGNEWIPIDRSTWSTITSLPVPWWLAAFDWLLLPYEQQISDICSANADDPALPTADVWASAFLVDRAAQQEIQNYIKAKLAYVAFQANCVCNAPTPGSPCTTWSGTIFASNCSYGVCALGSNCCYQTATFDSATPATSYSMAVPAGQHRVTMTVPGSPPIDGQIELYGPFTAENTVKLNIHPAIPNPSAQFDLNTSETKLEIAVYRTLGGAILDIPFTVSFQNIPGTESACGTTTPPSATTPTQSTDLVVPGAPICSSYQDVCNAMYQVSQKISWLQSVVPPISYLTHVTPSTVHAGLTGSGDITVSGILGFTVTLNTVPTSLGTEPGIPPTRWGASRISWADPYGVIGQQWIGETTEIIVPGTTTLLGYYFAPGVTATITELVAGK